MQDMGEQLDSAQFSNRKGRSPTHYLVNVVQFILAEAERGRHTNLLAIDYSKAFDKVDINVALRKLLDLHVRPELLPWLSDFLSNRQQCVRLDQTTSDWIGTTCGVPQGTKVGPVVFLAMLNDVASDFPSRWKYVDDITIGESRPNKAPVPPSTLPHVMNGICAQASDDHMSLSINKCALLQVSFGRDPPPPLDITTNGQHVANVTSMTLMGITLHRSLKWDAHVLGMITKANTRKYFLVTLRQAGTTTRHLLKFYITFIRPGLEYAAPV